MLAVKDLGIAVAGRSIVKNVSFSVQPQASLAVIGPNGSGKTLLLKALLGHIPFSGTIEWKPGTRLGYVPQRVPTDSQMPLQVRELLQAKARFQRLPGTELDAAIEWAGVREFLDQRIGALSGGQLQRVLIAFALVGSPNVLLVDEPTSSLDELAEHHVFQLINRTRQERGTTVILVSHDLTLARDLATHVLCLGGGAARFGTAREMLVPEILERAYGHPLEFHAHHLEDDL